MFGSFRLGPKEKVFMKVIVAALVERCKAPSVEQSIWVRTLLNVKMYCPLFHDAKRAPADSSALLNLVNSSMGQGLDKLKLKIIW